jgi:hypothetical protein
MDNNLAFTDFVELQQTAAEFVERKYPGARVATVWPLTSALSRPEFGYVTHAVPVTSLEDFAPRSVDEAGWRRSARVLVFYPRTWEPTWSWTKVGAVRDVLRRFYDFQQELSSDELRSRGLQMVARWERRGWWIEVYEARS